MTTTGDRHYGNFEDGFGLVGRMIRSKSAAAYWALVLAAGRAAFAPIDRVSERAERRRLSAAAGQDAGPMLLVVGAPRSGTTLAYQLLADALDVSYFTNATGMASRSPITISRAIDASPLGRRRQTTRRQTDEPNAYLSFYGNTAGLNAPNDGFAIWNRWLGTSRYRGPETLTPASAADMRAFFAAWSTDFEAPFLNKNNRNSDCVELLACALPGARFVEIRRDRYAVARSLIEARSLVQGSISRPWGLLSTDDEDPEMSPIEQVCRQVATIEATLDRAAAVVGPERHTRISYADLCLQPGVEVQRVLDAFPAFRLSPGFDLDRLSPFTNAADAKPRGSHEHDIERTFAELDLEATSHRPLDRAGPRRHHPGDQSR